jgi:hypothetical protein
LDKVLRVGSLTESIIVRGASPVVDVTATSTSTQFTRGGLRVSPRVNLYNALNSNIVTAWNLRAGPTYSRPSAILPPRIVELDIGISF